MNDFLHLPKDWEIIELASVAKVIDPHPSHRAPEEDSNGIPFAGIGDLDEYGNLRETKVRRVSVDIYDEHVARYKVSSNTIGFGRVASIGKIINFKEFRKKVTISPTMAIIEPNNINKLFLVNALKSLDTKSQVDLLLTGSTRSSLGIALLRGLKLPFPPLPEQKKIAAILTSVDEVIEKTQAQIDKLKDLKTAMMQTLLTNGVGTKPASADAALNNRTACRESYIPHTEFKDSPVGRIPKSWDCVQLESLLQSSKNSMRSGPFGSALLKHELVPNGHPYLGIDNVHIERFENKFKRYVSDEKFEQLKKYAVKENDVMITIMGTVGRSCVVPKGVGKALSSKHVWTMTFDQTKYISTLICWQLNYSDWVKLQFKNESQGGVMESISSRTLKELWLPRPPIQEQKKINEAHSSLSGAIRIKEALLNKHQLLKKALMQDLLTGKVRVKVEE